MPLSIVNFQLFQQLLSAFINVEIPNAASFAGKKIRNVEAKKHTGFHK
jgi:hypothetical protein